MSSSQLVDGKTGELIGGGYNAGYSNNTYTTQGGNYATSSGAPNNGYVTTTSSYVPAATTTTTNVYGTGSGANNTYTTHGGNTAGSYAVGSANTQYVSGGNTQYVSGAVGSGAVNTTTVTTTGQQNIVGTTVNTGKEVIKGESRIEYVPFEKKIIEYKDQAKVERVPKKVKKVDYREERKIESVPREVTVTDYYAVEYLRQYIPQYVPEKRVEYVQVPKKQMRYEYIPVERQIVHYPDQQIEGGAVSGGQYIGGQQQVIGGQQQVVGGTTTYTTTQYNGGQAVSGGSGYGVEQVGREIVYNSSGQQVSGNTYSQNQTGVNQQISHSTVPASQTVTYEQPAATYVVDGGSGSGVGRQQYTTSYQQPATTTTTTYQTGPTATQNYEYSSSYNTGEKY